MSAANRASAPDPGTWPPVDPQVWPALDPGVWPAFEPEAESERDAQWRRTRHECRACGVHTYVSAFVAAVGCCVNCGHGQLQPVRTLASDR